MRRKKNTGPVLTVILQLNGLYFVALESGKKEARKISDPNDECDLENGT